MRRMAIAATGVLLLFAGCSGMVREVKPWQKDVLASETMKKDGGNPLFYGFRKHIYYSKEGSKGGGGVAGGGCGCN